MKSRTHRITRLLRLITLLESGPGSNGTRLAQELGVSRRTFFRDLRTLQEAGVPCFHDAENGYRIARNFFLPPVNLTLAETLSLHLLDKTVTAKRMNPLNDELLAIANKLISTLDQSHRQVCRDLMKHVIISQTPTAMPDHGLRFFTALQRYIDECRACRMTISREVWSPLSPLSPPSPPPPPSTSNSVAHTQPGSTQLIECVIHPYALYGTDHHWSLLGVVNGHESMRVIPLDHVVDLVALEQRFERPSQFDAQQVIGLAWQTQPEGETYTIELQVKPEAHHLLATRWHASQHVKHNDPDDPLLCFTVDGLHEIADWIIQQGQSLRVKHPAQLRQIITARLRELADHHEQCHS